MLQKLKKQWRELKAAPAGKRFRQRYEERKKSRPSMLVKVLYLGGGLVIFLAGLVLLPAPGPGFIVVAVGATLMARESYIVARALDWTELRARRIWSAVRRRYR